MGSQYRGLQKFAAQLSLPVQAGILTKNWQDFFVHNGKNHAG